MEGVFFQAAGLTVVCAILCTTVKKNGPELAVLLSIACAAALLWTVVELAEPVVDFAANLRRISGIDSELTGVLMRAAGIGLAAELASAVCEDAGEGTLGRMAKLCGTAAAVYISLPLMERVLELLTNLLEG